MPTSSLNNISNPHKYPPPLFSPSIKDKRKRGIEKMRKQPKGIDADSIRDTPHRHRQSQSMVLRRLIDLSFTPSATPPSLPLSMTSCRVRRGTLIDALFREGLASSPAVASAPALEARLVLGFLAGSTSVEFGEPPGNS